MSKGQYFFEAQCYLPCLTTQTEASALKADQSMHRTKVHQTSLHQITFGAIGPKLLRHRPCEFTKSAEDVQIVGVVGLVSVSAAPPIFWPDLD